MILGLLTNPIYVKHLALQDDAPMLQWTSGLYTPHAPAGSRGVLKHRPNT